MLFEQTNVLSVCLDSSIGNITNKWNKTDEEIDKHVDQHHDQDAGRKTTFNLAHVANEVETKCSVGYITRGRNKTNDGRPTESETSKTEKGIIEAVGSLAGFGEDIGFLLGNVGGDLLLDFLRLARLLRVGNLLVKGVLGMLASCVEN